VPAAGSGRGSLPARRLRRRRAAVLAVAAEALPLVGLAVYGPKNPVDKIFKGFPLHS
jgi:hypothetical protein